MSANPKLAVAVAWMFGALISFAVMAVSVRELSGSMHAFQMLFLRSVIAIPILAAVLSFKGWGRLRTPRITGHVFRNIIHFTGQVFWILGITLLPLATVSAIEFTTPIWGALLAILFLGEKMHRGRWIALTVGFIGTLVILRPGLEVISTGAIIMLGCTFCFGATNTVTKWLTRTDDALTILFYMVTMQAVLGAVASLTVWTPIQFADWPWLLVLGLSGLSAHYSLTHALSAADATFIMPFDFLRLPLIAVVAFLLYTEPFEIMTFVGAALIFAGNYYGLTQERRLARAGGV